MTEELKKAFDALLPDVSGNLSQKGDAVAPSACQTGVYIASKTKHAEKWKELRATGKYRISSSWIDSPDCGDSDVVINIAKLWIDIVEDVRQSTGLILYVESEDFPLRGALVELGMTLALGRKVAVIAPGLMLDPTTLRPLGSWMAHPLVKRCLNFEEAFEWAASPSLQAQGETESLSDAAKNILTTSEWDPAGGLELVQKGLAKITAIEMTQEGSALGYALIAQIEEGGTPDDEDQQALRKPDTK